LSSVKIDSDELKRAREESGLTQEQLGVAAGLTGMTVHRLETGKTTWAQGETIEALAKELGIPARSLITENGAEATA
jgi:transcriptional regulator with XRE-family HTH domain